jgi:hypothetical protein
VESLHFLAVNRLNRDDALPGTFEVYSRASPSKNRTNCEKCAGVADRFLQAVYVVRMLAAQS